MGTRIGIKFALVVVIGVWALMPSSVSAAKARSAWVIPETLNVRSGPGTERKKIGTLTRGTKVHVTAFANNWCWAKLPDRSWGWIAEWLLQFSHDKGRALAEEAEAGRSHKSDAQTPAWIKGAAVNVRAGPGLGYKKYGTLPKGHKVYVIGRRSGWCKVSTGNGQGWILGELLEYDVSSGRKLAQSAPSSSKSSPEPQSTAKGFVVGKAVNLRKGPGTSYESKCIVLKGQTLYITETKGDWCKATVHGGNSGWIAKWLVKCADDSSSSSSSSRPAKPSSGRFETMPCWVSEEVINVRAGPGKEHDAKFQLERGTKVTASDQDGHWIKIKTSDGKVGWAGGWVVSFVPPGEAITAKEGEETVGVHVGWVARPKVNLRSGPSLDADRIGYAELSTRVVIIGQKGSWYRVAMDNGEVGWMASWLIDTRAQRVSRKDAASPGTGFSSLAGGIDFPSPTTRGGVSRIGDSIVQTAKKYLGYRYVRGSASPGRGFDCSGFVHYVMKQYGISLPRSSHTQFRKGQPVARSALQSGDVVFFKNTYKRGISHVGIYIGGDKFIHASNSRRDVVIDSLNSSYYAERYAGARRMY